MMYKDLVAKWPEPVELYHPGGDLFLKVSLLPDYIEARWYGHIVAENVVTAAHVYLALMQKTPKSKLLNDKTEATGDWTEANDWLEFEWLPKAVQSGLRCMAYVYSNNMFSRLSARDLLQRLTSSISIQHFNDPALAEDWLLSCHATSKVIRPTG